MQKIHVSHSGKVEGPYPLEVIREKILAGELSSADWAWWEGQTKWASLKCLPGLEFPSEDTPMDTEAQQDPGPIPCFGETQPAQHLSRERTSSDAPSEQTTRVDKTDRVPGMSVPDFRIEHVLWIVAGGFWLTQLARKSFLINFVAFLPVLVLFICTFVGLHGHPFPLAGHCFAIFIPAVVAPWSWIIMEQFRNHPVQMTDLFKAYLRAPLPLIGLGVISQLPLLPLMLPFLYLDIIPKVGPILLLFWLIIPIFIFFSANLLVDKRISLLNSIAFSFQAVEHKFFSMLLYLFLISVIAISGFSLVMFFLLGQTVIDQPESLFSFLYAMYVGIIFLVCIPIIFTILIAYASSIFAYLWVFSRDSLRHLPPYLQSFESSDQ